MRSLIIAPQWIGDAVMSEPLLARLAVRGERITVAALPWVAPVYRAMPQVAEGAPQVESPIAARVSLISTVLAVAAEPAITPPLPETDWAMLVSVP